MTGNDKKYFEYLQRRRLSGFFYRNYFLYPRICRYLDGRVLDVGCGIGDFLKFRTNTVGVDINVNNVKFCQSIGLKVSLMEPDRLPFENEQFDGVIMDNVLEHVESPETLLRDVRRVLRPHGTLVVGVPGSKGYLRDPDHKVFYDKQGLEVAVGRLGFKIGSFFCMPFESVFFDKHLPQYCLYVIFKRE
jgi:SAM-dependent methyltransferase